MQNVSGQRRAFLLPAAEDEPVAVTDELRGAPFSGDDGYFLMRLPRPGEDVDLTVSLHRNNHAALVAKVAAAFAPVWALRDDLTAGGLPVPRVVAVPHRTPPPPNLAPVPAVR